MKFIFEERTTSLASLSLKKFISAAVLATVSAGVYAGTTVITFDEDTIAGNLVTLQHGTVISSQYAALGVNVSVDNQQAGPDLGVLYNTSPGTSAPDKNNDRDSDLTGPNWGNSNFLSNNYSAGNTLIIQENNTGCGDSVCNRPDDQAGELAGFITFDLDFEISELGFELIDFQDNNNGVQEVQNSLVTVYNAAMEQQVFNFSDFSSAQYGAANFGENSINRIMIDGFNIAGVNKVQFEVHGTGALDTLKLTSTTTKVPEPTTLALFGLMLAGMSRVSRKK